MTFIQHTIGPYVQNLGSFSVKRVLSSAARQTVGSFILSDHMGPTNFAPGEGIDVRPHPHIGLAIITYLFNGNIVHRDSLDSVQTITPGDVNWMTVDNGIVHPERFSPGGREEDACMHGIQTWVALPKDQEKVNASFAHHVAETLPKLKYPGMQGVVIAGDAFGLTSPVKVSSRTLYMALGLAAGASPVVLPEHTDRGLYSVSGAVTIDGKAPDPRRLAVLEPGDDVTFVAQTLSRIMLLGGAPTDGHHHIYWDLIASGKADIEDAKQRRESDAFAHVPGETEHVPLPSR